MVISERGFYMKKAGFTLAEVLITLGIVGVIAAITLPPLMSDTNAAQIGPKLGKAVTTFEQANINLLNAYSADSLKDTGLMSSMADYRTELGNYLKLSAQSNYTATGTSNTCKPAGSFGAGTKFITKDGLVYSVNYEETSSGKVPHKQKIGAVYVDTNGASKPNILGVDIFAFAWYSSSMIARTNSPATVSEAPDSGTNSSHKY